MDLAANEKAVHSDFFNGKENTDVCVLFTDYPEHVCDLFACKTRDVT